MADGAHFTFHDLGHAQESFRDAVLAGLGRPKKSIPCKFLYDERGSALFEEICRLPEYYPTRTETLILEQNAPDIATRMGPECCIVEFGSGASHKARILLDALERPAAYVAVDISREHLRDATASLAEDFPTLAVIAVCADYTRPFRLPPLPARVNKRIGFFPGSTIGNFEPDEAEAFLVNCRRLLGSDGDMIIGVDLKKDPDILDAAYNDRAGVTAAFNLNLLERARHELGAAIDVARFAHVAFYSEARGRVEIYLKSLVDQEVRIAGTRIRFAAGELIHTEYSYKYSVAEFRLLARHAGFRPVATWTDRGELFSVHYVEAG
jgi:L-histidine N-alpha-methyltransferase